MAKTKISKAAKDFNISIATLVEFLHKKGIEVQSPENPNTRIDEAAYDLLAKEYDPDRELKKKVDDITSQRVKVQEKPKPAPAPAEISMEVPQTAGPKVIGKIDLATGKPAPVNPEPAPAPQPEVKKPEAPKAPEVKPEPAKAEVKPKAEPEHQVPAAVPVKPVVETKPKAEVKAPEKVVPAVPEPQPKQKEQKEHTETAPAPKPETKKPEAPKAPEKKPEPAAPAASATQPKAEDSNFIPTQVTSGLNINVVGKIDLSAINQTTRPKKKSKEEKRNERLNAQNGNAGGDRKKRRRISGKEKVDIERSAQQGSNQSHGNNGGGGGNERSRGERSRGRDRERERRPIHNEVNEEDVQKQVKETLARLTNKDKGQKKGAKWRKEKREANASREREQHEMERAESKVLKLTEFVTVNDLASMMDVPVNNIIATCMSLGEMVSINQRLDAETINIVAEEFGFRTEYVSAEVADAITQEEDAEEDLMARPPIVTVMGHVDHGKTSLLDYIRNANVIAGEAGGITQHIGAYNVKMADGRHITFLDTPGHEAFTAMRARGAKVTDLCIIIVAADDNVMPQTVEAINHASAAGVPIVFAINKIDKPAANPDKIKEELAGMNYLVEDWGGKYQSQDISAKKGIGVDELMEKVLLEAELLDLKANPNRKATGSIIESSLDKGRGYVATVLVQNGTLRVGDIILAGTHYGKVRAMFNERNQRIKEAGPAEPALILGLNGAPTAGDTFNVMDTDQEAREIASKREQLQRELGLRTKKLLTLEDIGRRRAIGNFQELNIIVKGDVDGSIEALSDSLIKLSTPEIQVNVLHKAVGEISESDVTLAAASDAIIIGFQVRPSQAARRAAERDGVEIRLYSVIYQAIEEVKDAMEGMLAPEVKEEVIGTAEVMQTYRISKVGTVAGCLVREGKLRRNAKVRLIRDGIVRYTGDLGSLKRFKDDVKEVTQGYDCGLNITGYNDIREGDIVECFEEVEVKKSL
ncbi:MAG: translation initiation factor IF-2 [Firmicutes bacterium]|nr:translation initiation factor IF-2 [Bacillota bacterium]MCM1400723.1 translation initiation factor IF-2 [Bacteroides sp.]MCM1476417.1 translation initiation factor IF-2 [Bacteroides sp.]